MKLWMLFLLVLLVGFMGFFIVQNSTAQTVGTTLLWTAPGDDGLIGRASAYDIRYRTTPIVGTDTLTWWNGSTQALGEPLPGLSGAADSMRVLGLQPSTQYYFVLKAGDEVPNWSRYSNVASVITADLIPPSSIRDLIAR